MALQEFYYCLLVKILVWLLRPVCLLHIQMEQSRSFHNKYFLLIRMYWYVLLCGEVWLIMPIKQATRYDDLEAIFVDWVSSAPITLKKIANMAFNFNLLWHVFCVFAICAVFFEERSKFHHNLSNRSES